MKDNTIKIKLTWGRVRWIGIAVALLAVAIGVWIKAAQPLDSKELAATDVEVEREDVYMLLSGADTLVCLPTGAAMGADDFNAFEQEGLNNSTVALSGQWVNRMPVIPSCGGRLMVESIDTPRVCNATTDSIQRMIKRQRALIRQRSEIITEQLTHVEYYLQTHNVTEGGFDVVMHVKNSLTTTADSLSMMDSLLAKAENVSPLKIVRSSRYYALWDKKRVACESVEERDGLMLIRTKDGEKPENLSTRLTIYDNKQITKRIALRHKPKVLLPLHTRVDSAGVYTGAIDSVGTYHGYGRLVLNDGGYYEGDWEHGIRHGFGFALSPRSRMQIGEWKKGKYLGERITYTSERIYGIDISRWQHEVPVKSKVRVNGRKGKRYKTVTKMKRYGINWDNLAITSLGTLSKKTIAGDVNYKISFIYIKCTEGTSIFNAYYNGDYKQSRAHGYHTGAYHFFSTKSSGARQAAYFLQKMKYQKGDFPPVLDVEPTAKQIQQMGGASALMREIRTWLKAVEKATGCRPILYVSQTFVNRYLPSAPDIMKDYQVWIARYGEYKPNVNLVYWQLCPDGRVRGIQTPVDINVFNGFEPEWSKFVAQ